MEARSGGIGSLIIRRSAAANRQQRQAANGTLQYTLNRVSDGRD